MTSRYRLVAVDLDGTLLQSDESLSARSKGALDLLASRDAVLVLVTGRPWRWLRDLLDLVHDDALVVCLNGAATVSASTGAIVDASPLSVEAAAATTALLRGRFPDTRFAVETTDGFGHESGYRQRRSTGTEGLDRIEMLFPQGDVLKLLAQHPTLDAQSLRDAVAQAEPGTGARAGEVHATFSSPRVLEISGVQATKATALARLATRLGVRSTDVLAFGNMPNDTAMLTWAGHGVAVANAHPEVLTAADEVTLGNDDDGVAAVLEREFGLTGV